MQPKRILLPLGAITSFGLLAATYRAYRRDMRKALARVSTGSSIIETRRGRIEYASIGEGSPLLVIHGAGGGFDQAMDFAAVMNNGAFRCIFVSRFGYLRSPLPVDGSAECQADLYASLLDSLGVSEAAIMGVSAGAPSAMQFAIRYPQRCSALILLVPATFAPHGASLHPSSPTITQLLANTILKSDLAFWLMIHLARGAVIENILGTPFEVLERASPAEQERLQTMLTNILPVSRRRTGLFNDGAVVSRLGRFELERITAPTLLISVEDDRYGTFSGAQYTAGQIRNARFLEFPTGGHLWLGHNEEVCTAVRDFLQGTARTRGATAKQTSSREEPPLPIRRGSVS